MIKHVMGTLFNTRQRKMAKKSNAGNLVKVTPNLNLPDYLQDQPVQGLDELKNFVVPPVLKIIQKQSADELLTRFNVGDCIVLPAEAVVALHTGQEGEPEIFNFVPLFFYSEYCTWTPIELRGQVPAILERTLDRGSPLARKATNSKLWAEEIEHEGRKIKVRHVEHLNYVVTLYNHPLAGEPMIMSFSKGEHSTGSRLASMIKMRKASLYANVFQAHVSVEPRKNQKGSWFGYDIENPTAEGVSPWVTKDELERFRVLFNEVNEYYKHGRLRTEYDPSDDADPAAAAAVAGDEI